MSIRLLRANADALRIEHDNFVQAHSNLLFSERRMDALTTFYDRIRDILRLSVFSVGIDIIVVQGYRADVDPTLFKVRPETRMNEEELMQAVGLREQASTPPLLPVAANDAEASMDMLGGCVPDAPKTTNIEDTDFLKIQGALNAWLELRSGSEWLWFDIFSPLYMFAEWSVDACVQTKFCPDTLPLVPFGNREKLLRTYKVD